MPADHESAGSRAAPSNLSRTNSETIMISMSDSRSHVYPHPPSPLHFTQLHYPKSTVLTPAHSTRSRRHRRSSSSFRCCCCSCFAALCSLLLTACTFLGLAALITWLVLRPISSPRYSIETVEFKSINVTSSAALHADVDYTVTATNPNRRLGFRYDRMEFETSYQGHVFGRSAVAAFYQGHRNVSVFSSGFVVDGFVFSPETLSRQLANDWKLAGRVALHLKGRAKVRVKVGIITSWALNVLVDCDFVVAAPSGKVSNKVCSTK